MDPRIILEALQAQLEEIVARAPYDELPTNIKDAMDSGKLEAAQALRRVRAALVSGDPDEMLTAALVFPTFLRDARKRAIGYAEKTRQLTNARTGAARSGRERHDIRVAVWLPRIERFAKLLDEGVGTAKARAVVTKEIRAGGQEIADSTVRKWLTKKNIALLLKKVATQP
jgi:hypothetical protein